MYFALFFLDKTETASTFPKFEIQKSIKRSQLKLFHSTLFFLVLLYFYITLVVVVVIGGGAGGGPTKQRLKILTVFKQYAKEICFIKIQQRTISRETQNTFYQCM
jgi:hypothetical protein